MKKIVAVLLAASMLMGLAGCKKSESSESETTAPSEQSSEATDATSGSESQATDESTDASESEGDDANTPGHRETKELFDGAYALDYTFEDPDEFPWFTYSESGGKFSLACEDGKMVAKIEDPGTKKHSCQVYHDGFAMHQNAEYQVEFDIWGDVERTFEWRIQLNGGDYHAYYVEEEAKMGTEPTHISAVFTMYEPSDPAPRFAFNLGIEGGAQNIYIDNLTMVVARWGIRSVEELTIENDAQELN